MRVPCRQRWVLWRLSRDLRRSDPHLAAILAIFGRLNAGEAIDSNEQAVAASEWASSRLDRAWIAVRRQFSLNAAVGLPRSVKKPGLA
jgi:hypothetical protein